MLAFCWAHVRRRFYELAAAGPAPIASEALRRIAEVARESAVRPDARRCHSKARGRGRSRRTDAAPVRDVIGH